MSTQQWIKWATRLVARRWHPDDGPAYWLAIAELAHLMASSTDFGRGVVTDHLLMG